MDSECDVEVEKYTLLSYANVIKLGGTNLNLLMKKIVIL